MPYKVVLGQSTTAVQLLAVEFFIFSQILAIYINFISQIPWIRHLTVGMQNDSQFYVN